MVCLQTRFHRPQQHCRVVEWLRDLRKQLDIAGRSFEDLTLSEIHLAHLDDKKAMVVDNNLVAELECWDTRCCQLFFDGVFPHINFMKRIRPEFSLELRCINYHNVRFYGEADKQLHAFK